MASPPIEEDDAYASSEDSDFAPDDAPQLASDSEEDGDSSTAQRVKRPRPTDGADSDGGDYDNSGDEAIIQRGKKKQKRSKAKGATAEVNEYEEGGEGGLVKTRRQRAAEKEERKFAASRGPVTVDVDALWAQMISGNPTTRRPGEGDGDADGNTGSNERSLVQGTEGAVDPAAIPTKTNGDGDGASDMIRIKRTYNFAGRVHTDEKLVARDSAEAKLYLANHGEETATGADNDGGSPPARRITKKAFRSAFEPVLESAAPGRADLNLGVAARAQAAKEARAKKLNTVEKSRMDWAGYVDQEGLKDELELAGRSKDSYAARQDFLARSEAIRDGDARKARMSGRV